MFETAPRAGRQPLPHSYKIMPRLAGLVAESAGLLVAREPEAMASSMKIKESGTGERLPLPGLIVEMIRISFNDQGNYIDNPSFG